MASEKGENMESVSMVVPDVIADPEPPKPDTAESLRIDPNSLDLGELVDFEEAAGKEFHEFLGDPMRDEDGHIVRDAEGNPVLSFRPNARAMLALAWIAKRRSDPSFTLEDAKRIKVVDATGAKQNPTDASGSQS